MLIVIRIGVYADRIGVYADGALVGQARLKDRLHYLLLLLPVLRWEVLLQKCRHAAAPMLAGLADYGDTPSPAADAGDAPSAAADAPASGQQSLLSIVEYTADDGNTEEAAGKKQGAASLGISMDEHSVSAAQPNRVGGVGARFTTEVTRSGGGGGSGSTSEDRPAFVVPDSPPGDVEPKLLERHAKNVQHHLSGHRVNEYIRNSKKFRNPHLLDQLTAFLGTESHGTNYPKELYDPKAFGEHEYVDKLEEARKEWEVRQSRKQGEAVAFRSAGAHQLQPPAAASGVGAEPAPAPAKRKSKWDTGGDAKRSSQ